jgi:uncharacterized protein YcaQ
MASRDFEDTRHQRGTRWDWKPAKTALEVLFERGDLMVDRRVNFQRYYNLAERVLPAGTEPPAYTLEDWTRWAALRSVAHLGVATPVHASDYYRQSKPSARSSIEALAGEGTIVPAEVEGWKEIAYVNAADLPLIEEIESGAHTPTLTVLLSPFDNLLWYRPRVLELFGFDYRAEMYRPKAKRVYGYYVLPILHKGRLVGRLDPKADRQSGTLIVRAIYLEPNESPTSELVDGIAGALREFMAFHGSERVTVERSEPEALRSLLLERLAQH